MNRFRRHRKEKANRNDLVHSEKGTTTTIISSLSGRKDKSSLNLPDDGFADHQKPQDPSHGQSQSPSQPQQSPKVTDFDVSNALPAPEDFRTSLLMPKLSARFSMLKEQDDPESLLGKANDDSVLFPKRASRLDLFGHNHPSKLADIEEMSIRSGRPGHVDSCASGDTDDDRSQSGSIMSRARRAEGNNLFGGRQKVYKIPTKATSPNPSEKGRAGIGRALYEHDVTPSAFQRMRMERKEEDTSLDSSPVSPSDDTFSSIAGSTLGRSSTAATSIDEQQQQPPSAPANDNLSVKPLFPERGGNKTRRLYGQGLAQSVQNQQHSTLNRLGNLSRQRPGTPELPPMNRAYSRSATNLRDRLQKLGVADPPSRPTSPPLSSSASPRPQLVEEPAPHSFGGIPPLSPPISEVEEERPQALAAALQPEDHGKATAAGLFHKPRLPFDENQFTRRQLQMHEGRNTPPLQQPQQPQLQQLQPPSERRPPSPPHRATPTPPEPIGRVRGLSNASDRSRPKSASSHYEETQHADNRSRSSSINALPARSMGTTFFANSSPSDSGDDYEEEENNGPDSRSSMDGIHPALRSQPPSHDEQDRHPLPEVRFSDLNDLKPIAENDMAENDTAQDEGDVAQEPDSPTLGPSGLGLSGLVRTHLRQDSDKSAQLPSPGLPPTTYTPETEVPESKLADATSSDSTISAQSSEPRNSGSWIDNNNNEDDGDDDDNDQDNDLMRSLHQRSGSTETQREREEFANELAERRRRVQEKLQGSAASDLRPASRTGSLGGSLAGSRSGSPAPSRQTPDPIKPGNAFALLRSRAGKNAFFPKPTGLGNSSTPSLALDQNDPWREEDESVVPFPGLGTNQQQHIPEQPSMRSRFAAFARRNSREGSRESSRSRNGSPASSIPGFRARRDRSRSDASTRSMSRSRRDDLGTVEEGSVISHDTIMLPGLSYDPNGNGSIPSTRRQSMDTVSEADTYERSSSVASNGRYRSDSRSGPSSYFDLIPPPTGPPPAIGTSPRPSPIAPYSANATPPLYEISPDPTSPPAPTFAAAASHVVPQRAPGHTGPLKRPVNKTLISEPTLVSCTSNVPTVGLPPSASLSNGMDPSPPPAVPPMNPRRRRQTTTQTIMGAFKNDGTGRGEEFPSTMPGANSNAGSFSSGHDMPEERSVFEDSSNTRRPMSRRLRKTSSEGGSLNTKIRSEAMMSSSSSSSISPPPPLPPPQHPPPRVPMDGGMF